MKRLITDKEWEYNLRLDRLRDALRLLMDNLPRIPDGSRWESLRNAKKYALKILDEEKVHGA